MKQSPFGYFNANSWSAYGGMGVNPRYRNNYKKSLRKKSLAVNKLQNSPYKKVFTSK